MKKLFLLMVGAILMIACEGPVGPPGPQGPEGPGMNWKIQFVPVNPNQWVRDYDPNSPEEVYYIYTFTPEVYIGLNQEDRKFIYNEGSMMAYWLINYNTEQETQIPLYYGYNKQYPNGNSYIENIRFQYTVNQVSFIIYYNDPNSRPEDVLDFRLVTNW